MAEACGLGLYLLQEAAGRHGSRILPGDDGGGLLLRTAAAADEPRRREQRVRRRLLSLTLGASADAAETQRAARAPAPTRRRSSRAAQRPSLCLGARAPAPRRRSYGRRAAEPGGARAARALTLTFAPPPPPHAEGTRRGAPREGSAVPAAPSSGLEERKRRARARSRGLPAPTAAAFWGLGALGGRGPRLEILGKHLEEKKKLLCLEKRSKSQFPNDAEASAACKT